MSEQQQKPTATKIEKSFMGIDHETKYLWWKEEISYLFLAAKQITEVKIVPATDSTFNVYARLDLKDRFEYKLIDNKKTLAAAKKLAEDFVKLLNQEYIIDAKDIPTPKSETKETEKNLNGLEALLKLKEDLVK